MKKLLTAAIGVIANTVAAQAQIIETTPYEFTAGASAGATFSSIAFTPKVTQQQFRGLTFGLTGRMTMGENVGLQAELNYSQQGWSELFEEAPEYQYNRRLHYLQLPFYTRVQFGGRSVKGFINAGPQVGYLIGESTSENLNAGAPMPGRSDKQHGMAATSRFEWGIGGGPGIEIRTGAGYFLIEGRYFYAFGDIYGTRREDAFSKASNQVVTVKLSYLIPL